MSQRRAAVALVSVSSVVKVLDAMMKSVVAGSESVEFGDQIRGVDVGYEACRDPGVGVVTQRPIGHRRAEVRAADADVDHRLDPLAGRTRPVPGTQPVGEVAHRVEHGMDVGLHVLAVDLESGSRGERRAV